MSNEFKESFVVRTAKAKDSPLRTMEADASFAYVGTRAASYWPVVNGNGAFWLEHSKGETKGLSEIIGSDNGFKFGLANVFHSVGPGKTNQVIGAIREEASVEGSGVDIIAQIDKRACEAYSIDPQDFAAGGEFNSVSIEILCDRDKSLYVALTSPGSKNLDDQTLFTAQEAASQGVRRTAWNDDAPYLYQDKYVVVEGCSPIRCRGIAFVPDPADKTANVFEVAANLETAAAEPYGNVSYADPGFRGKKRYPVDTAEHTRAAASYFGKPENRDKYTTEQRDHIDREIAKAKKEFGIGDEETSGFSLADSDDVPTADTMLDSYVDEEPIDVNAAMDESVPSSAYADVYFDPEENAEQRSYPLYASAKSFAEDRPHSGLVKAALQAHVDGKLKNPSMALQRLQVAHSKLHGAKSMTDLENLATEKAALESKLAEIKASLEDTTNAVSAKDTEIASLTDALKTATDEIASYKAKEEGRLAEERANQRLAKLTAIDGFSIKDEEKAGLVESLKSEDELAFENRVLKATVASMEEAAKKLVAKKPDEEDASLLAAAGANLDIFPTGDTSKTGKVDVYSVM